MTTVSSILNILQRFENANISNGEYEVIEAEIVETWNKRNQKF